MKIKDLTKKYGSLILFHQMNLEIDTCGLYLIKGESGIGKTTLLNILAGYERADKGIVDLEGRSIAYSLQNQRMIEEMDVKSNLALYDILYNGDSTKRLNEIISCLDLTKLMHHYPKELSRGQRQRLAIAQTLLSGCHILLFDEPTEYLDSVNRQAVIELLQKESKNKIIIITSHETDLIMQYDPICYEIKKHDLILQKQPISNNKISDHELKDTESRVLNPSALFQITEKIVQSSRQILFQRLLFLLLVILFVFQSYACMMLKLIRYDTYQSDVYVARLDEQSELSLNHIPEVEPIPQFQPLSVNGEFITPNVIPFHESMRDMQKRLTFTGEKEPFQDRIVVNQNFCEILNANRKETCLGERIVLVIPVKEAFVSIPFVIEGIVNEPDALHIVQGYYNMEYVQNYLSAKGMLKEWRDDSKLYWIKDTSIMSKLRETYAKKSLYIGNIIEDAHSHEQAKLDTYRQGFFFVFVLLSTLSIAFLCFLLHIYWSNVKGSLAVLSAVVKDLPVLISAHLHALFHESSKVIFITSLEVAVIVLILSVLGIELPIYCYLIMVLLSPVIILLIYFAVWCALHLLKRNRLFKILKLGEEEI
ncbi:MAG: ABC transporter ATP-binding protein [Erysipelotrichaceae bacterium]|nr:ABC transporter ATP-binding protein [Erysipelotrichaceae bacterium]